MLDLDHVSGKTSDDTPHARSNNATSTGQEAVSVAVPLGIHCHYAYASNAKGEKQRVTDGN